VALFCKSGAPTVRNARTFAPEIDISADWKLIVLDGERAERTAGYFGLRDVSGMAVVEKREPSIAQSARWERSDRVVSDCAAAGGSGIIGG